MRQTIKRGNTGNNNKLPHYKHYEVEYDIRRTWYNGYLTNKMSI